MREMRRKDKLATNIDQIEGIIKECDVIRLGFADGEFPYIVPLNYGYEIIDEQIYFYIHGASDGRKVDLIKQNGKCSFQMDRSIELDLMPEVKDLTTRYVSLFGHAKIELLEGEEKWHGVKVLMDYDDRTRGYEYNKDAVPNIIIAKITVLDYTGKLNRPRNK